MCSRSASAKLTAAQAGAAACSRRKQVTGADLQNLTWGKDDRSLDDVLQFAYIPRPGVADQGIHDCGRDGLDPLAHPPRELLDEVADQRQDTVRPIPQGR